MNCNPCCGCCPPITTYNPSVADTFPTILQQVEYLKALLKKYPSQQWFITQEKVTEETIKLDSTKIPLRGRAIAVGDFILGNTINGTILIFQYTGAMTELTYYVVEYVGVYTNQGVAEEALAKAQAADTKAQAADTKAQNALDLAKTNEKDISTLDGQVADIEAAFIIPDDTVFPYEFNNEILFKIVNNIIKVLKYKNIIYYRFKLQSYAMTFVGFIPSSDYNKIGQYHIIGADLIYATGKGVLVDKGKTDFLSPDSFKTIFGNQSLIGTGNIDLYKHHIDIAGTYNGMQIGKSTTAGTEAFIEFYSSNNLKVDSLTDLKTLLGDTFMVGCKGVGWDNSVDKPIILDYMDESYLHAITNSFSYFNIPLSAITFTDTVKTI